MTIFLVGFLTFRCVPDNQRTYALGLQWLFLCMFGSMPGPVVFGAFIDKTCILWEETCSGRGSCLEYNNELLSYLLVAAGLFFQSKTFSCVTVLILMFSDVTAISKLTQKVA